MTDMGDRANALDESGMLGHLRSFPADLAGAWDRSTSWDISKVERKVYNGVICLGMGGSASGGDFLACLSELGGCLPFISHRGYELPTWVSEKWLVMVTSYSGNTEETLDALECALNLGCDVVGFSSGGALQSRLEASEQTWIPLPGGQPPRSAFGHIFGSQIALVWRLGIQSPPENLGVILEHLTDAVEACDFTLEDEEGDVITEMAQSFIGKQVSILAVQSLSPTSYRAACQFNENGGVFARSQVIPEMNHNEIVAWGEANATENQALLLFSWDGTHERVSLRLEWMLDNIPVEPTWGIVCEGDSHLEALLYSVVIMDWLSCAIALLRGKDPTAIGPINGLKAHLS
jgi:glucose/mannose-6-phosphate isomerase